VCNYIYSHILRVSKCKQFLDNKNDHNSGIESLIELKVVLFSKNFILVSCFSKLMPQEVKDKNDQFSVQKWPNLYTCHLVVLQ